MFESSYALLLINCFFSKVTRLYVFVLCTGIN